MVIKKNPPFFETKSCYFFSFFFLSAIKHTLFERGAVLDKYLKTHTVNKKLKRVNYKLEKFRKKKKRTRVKMFVVTICLRNILRQYFLCRFSLLSRPIPSLCAAKEPFSFQNIPYIFLHQPPLDRSTEYI